MGITRAKEELTITCARQRMIRGETQYNKVSRFVREIPVELLSSGKLFEEKKSDIPKENAYFQARKTFQSKPFTPAKPKKQFGVAQGEGLDYAVGDRVRHVKFGVGTVTDITEGGRDYEVTVDFDQAGTKKMFAAFARLKKV